MLKKKLYFFIITILLIASVIPVYAKPLDAYDVTVSASGSQVPIDDYITIAGSITENGAPFAGAQAALVIKNASGDIYDAKQVTAGADGKYSYQAKISAIAVLGKYTAEISFAGITKIAEFTVFDTALYALNVETDKNAYIELDDSIDVSGVLTRNGVGWAGVPVAIALKKVDAGGQNDALQPLTTIGGAFNCSFPTAGLLAGTYQVEVSYAGQKATKTILFINVLGVTLDKTGLTLNVGTSQNLTATVLPAGALNKDVTWTSDNTSVATVINGKVTAIAPGTAVITATSVAGGKTATCSVTVPSVPLVTKGTIDKPSTGQSVTGITTVTGWFLDASGVEKIEIFVDGVLKGQAVYGSIRNDVYNAYPAYNNHNSGFSYTLDTSKILNGSRTITVKETSKSGATTSINKTIKVVQPPKGTIDKPTANQQVSGKLTVNGWFLDGNGIKKVEVLIDGVLAGQAVYGGSRSDVLNAYPQYNNSNSGYTFTKSTASMTPGTHKVTVRGVSNTNVVTTLPVRYFTVVQPVKGVLDKPTAGQTISGTFTFSGWSLDMLGVSKVELWIDGTYLGDAAYGSVRNDVYNAYPQFNNHNSGFSYSLNTALYSNGVHNVVIKEVGSTGVVTTLATKSITINN